MKRIMVGLAGVAMLLMAGTAVAEGNPLPVLEHTRWACIGFNSASAVQNFLSGETNDLVRSASAKTAKVVTMPNAGGDVPLFEVFIANPSNGTTFDPSTIPDGMPCP